MQIRLTESFLTYFLLAFYKCIYVSLATYVKLLKAGR